MEKISRIVGANSRVAAVDLKNSAPVRPGTPSFGRPVGVSTRGGPNGMTTAQKAIELMNEADERKRATHDAKQIQNLADQFFLTTRDGLEGTAIRAPEVIEPVITDAVAAGSTNETEEEIPVEMAPPSTYTPRGSYVDVRA